MTTSFVFNRSGAAPRHRSPFRNRQAALRCSPFLPLSFRTPLGVRNLIYIHHPLTSWTAPRFIETDCGPSPHLSSPFFHHPRGVAPWLTAHRPFRALSLDALHRIVSLPSSTANFKLHTPNFTLQNKKRRQFFRFRLSARRALVSLSCDKHEKLTPKCASFRLLIPQL